jgi:hypothetical protein
MVTRVGEAHLTIIKGGWDAHGRRILIGSRGGDWHV